MPAIYPLIKTPLQKISRMVENQTVLPLLAVLLLAVVFRLSFPTGVVFDTDFSHAQLAFEFANIIKTFFSSQGAETGAVVQSLHQMAAVYGINQIATYLPVSLAYLILGVNDYASLALPMISSIVGLLLVYGITCRIATQKAGLLAGLLWSFLPTDIYYGTMMSSVGLFFVFTAGAVYFYLSARSNDTTPKKSRNFILAAFCIAVATLINKSGWVIIIVLAALTFSGTPKRNSLIIVITAVAWTLLGILLSGGPGFLTTAPDILYGIYDNLSREPGWFMMFPIFGMACIVGSIHRYNELAFSWCWIGCTYPFYSLYWQNGVGVEKFLLPTLAPVIILVAVYLANAISQANARLLALGYGLTMTPMIWLASRASEMLVDLQPISIRLIDYLSTLTAGIVFCAAFTAPVFIPSRGQRWRKIAVTIFLWLLGFTMIHPTQIANAYPKYIFNYTRSTFNYLIQQEKVLPVYIGTSTLNGAFQYLSGFQWLTDNKDGFFRYPLRLVPENLEDIGDAYVILPAGSQYKTPEKWWSMAHFGSNGRTSFRVFRSLSREEGKLEYQTAQAALQSSPNEANWTRLSGAAQNDGKFCESIQAWVQANNHAHYTEMRFIPLSIITNCFIYKSKNLLVDDNWQISGYSFAYLDPITDPQTLQPAFRFHKKKFADLKTLFQPVKLDPDSLYLLRIDVRSDDNLALVTPFWKLGDTEMFLETGSYTAWKSLSALIKTPSWNDQPQGVLFSPFLFNGSTIAYFKNMELVKVEVQ